MPYRISAPGRRSTHLTIHPQKNRDNLAWLRYSLRKALEKRSSGRQGLRRFGERWPAYSLSHRGAVPLVLPRQGGNNETDDTDAAHFTDRARRRLCTLRTPPETTLPAGRGCS